MLTLSYYAVAANIVDPNDDTAEPTATDSVNSTSQNTVTLAKVNFWALSDSGDPWGYLAYDPLYPPTILGLFPFIPDLGLPAPDVVRLYLGDGTLHAEQAAMPGTGQPLYRQRRAALPRLCAGLPVLYWRS